MDFRLGAAAIVTAALLAPAVARGDASATDRDNARTYMSDGRAKRDAGDLRGALRAFQAADALMHVPTTALEVAKTEALLGMLIEAREDALQIARSQAKPGEATPFAEARTAAQKLADEVEPRIPSVRLVLKGAEGATVSVDDMVVPPIAIGLPRRVDPGNHVIVAKVGSRERRIDVQVLERESKEVTVDLPTVTTAPPTTTPPNPPHDTPPNQPHGSAWMAVGVTALVVGGAGLVLGGITGAMSLSQTSTIKGQCASNGACPPMLSDGQSTSNALASARMLAIVSDVGFIAGGVVATLGLVFVVASSTHKARTLALHVGPGSLGVAGWF